jgi:Flp pilus assembly protein TadG
MGRIGNVRVIAVWHRLSADVRGGVALIGALSLSILVGMGAFAVEASQGYSAKVTNQRVADTAALAAALAYNVNSSTSEMSATATAVVKAQGLAGSTSATALTTDDSGNPAVRVTVTTPVPLALARVLTSAVSYDVVSVALASVSATTTSAPPCIAALSSTPTYGITLSGGTNLGAPGCAINTNAGVTVPWGTYITAKEVNAGKSVNNPGGGLTTTPTAGKINANKSNAASDWMKDNSALKAALCQVNKLTGTSDADYPDGNTICTSVRVLPTAQSVSGGANWTLGYNKKMGPGIDQYQTADYSCQYNIPAGTYTVGALKVPGGCSITFASGSTLKFQSIDMSGSGMTVGDGSFIVVSTFGFNSGSLITIGNGYHSFGTLVVTGGRTLNIGSGDLNVTGDITMGGGSYLRVAMTTGDVATIGNNGTGRAIYVDGGSYLCFTANCSAPTAATAGFHANGSVVTSGGSTLIFPKATNHVLNGDLNLNGSSTFGSGLYIIKGNFTNNTGGTMSGTDISFALGGTFTLSGGTSLDLAAPTTSSSYGIPNVLVATKSSSATKIGGGSTNKYGGLVYAPKSDILLDGGASMSSNAANCLMLIVNTLTLNGGTAVGSTCSGLTGGSSTTANVALVK